MRPITFWRAQRDVYAGSLAFIRALPVLALVPVVFELLQHAVEAHLGMYDSMAAALAQEGSPSRIAFGLLKVASLTVPTWWVVRFLATRDPHFATRSDALALWRFGVFVVVQLLLAALQLVVLPRDGAGAVVVFFASLVVGALLAAWAVGASLGNARMGPIESIRLMARRLPWSLAFVLVAMLPLMLVHYALAFAALVAGKALLWPLLVADALVVGLLCPVLIAGSFHPAMRAARLAGVSLLPAKLDAATPVSPRTPPVGAAPPA